MDDWILLKCQCPCHEKGPLPSRTTTTPSARGQAVRIDCQDVSITRSLKGSRRVGALSLSPPPQPPARSLSPSLVLAPPPFLTALQNVRSLSTPPPSNSPITAHHHPPSASTTTAHGLSTHILRFLRPLRSRSIHPRLLIAPLRPSESLRRIPPTASSSSSSDTVPIAPNPPTPSITTTLTPLNHSPDCRRHDAASFRLHLRDHLCRRGRRAPPQDPHPLPVRSLRLPAALTIALLLFLLLLDPPGHLQPLLHLPRPTVHAHPAVAAPVTAHHPRRGRGALLALQAAPAPARCGRQRADPEKDHQTHPRRAAEGDQ